MFALSASSGAEWAPSRAPRGLRGASRYHARAQREQRRRMGPLESSEPLEPRASFFDSSL
eukprot:2220590-Alexandrium_andersonii.AAC.1